MAGRPTQRPGKGLIAQGVADGAADALSDVEGVGEAEPDGRAEPDAKAGGVLLRVPTADPQPATTTVTATTARLLSGLMLEFIGGFSR